ncbi:hypothetical protein IV203_006072 [Nitzschia inconspicua]|uniref:Restriction endonuclease domain-containing protein n=1 Tax=Nitzschia inconspicua TaxID=303405 RepID=A0A9K3KNH4_9STRA|nr:hypothetical protein IV203_006072 [Nitzschia inconspicua]
MIEKTTPQQEGKQNYLQGGSPQSDTSDSTTFASKSCTSTYSSGSDPPQPGSSPTLEDPQEGLPEEIMRKTYPTSNLVSAEDELFEDLKEHSMEDSDKVIVINQDGKAIWAMPSVFHQYVLQKLLQIINKCSEEEDPLLAQADIPLLVDKKTKRCRHPDVSIWGPGRLEVEEDGDAGQKFISVEGMPGECAMNPHVIIEFSWTNQIENELWKLQEQMKEYVEDLGTVNLGLLIKAIPVKGKKCPSLEDLSVPLAGFDVYCFRSRVTTDTTSEPILKYRLGTDEATTVIEISGRDLGRRNPAEAVRIPLSAIRRVCEKWGLKFKAEAT